MMKSVMLTIGLLVTVLGTPLISSAGGTITGKVTYSGKPEEKEFLFSKFPNPKFCRKPAQGVGKRRQAGIADHSGGNGWRAKAAVVAVRDIEDQVFMDRYKGTDHIAEFCEWLPFTGIVVKQKNFHVENLDADPTDPKSVKGVLHNPHSFEMLGSSSITLFNIALPEKGSKLDKPLVLRKDKQGSIVRLQCDQHEFMQPFFLPVTNLYYAVVKDDGTFEIEDVPAGKHKLLAWHPFAGRVEIEVDVPEGRSVQTKLEIKK